MDDSPSSISETASDEQQAVDAASHPYVGRWNQLVSTTNWEKGRIIDEWREALITTEAAASEYSDEAWSLRVGGVTGQHVGRLRRVWRRFGSVYADYEGLYWSHFQAALDWEDAEMWLEGAVQNGWSVSQLRRQRWETLGSLPDQRPDDRDIVVAETDEDFEPAVNAEPTRSVNSDRYSEVQGPPIPEGPDFGDEDDRAGGSASDGSGPKIFAEDANASVEFVQPFANLADLPEDLGDAFESYKLAILRHKAEHWAQIAQEDVLASLEALKLLVTAPSAENATSGRSTEGEPAT